MRYSLSNGPAAIPLQMLLIVLIGGLLAAAANLVHPRRIPWVEDWEHHVENRARQAGIDVIALQRAYALHGEGRHLFIDARATARYDEGHIPHALSLPFEAFYEEVVTMEQLLNSGKPLILYCRNRECDDALLLARELQAMGKTNLLYYVDGFELWEASGCPVETL